MRSWRRFIAGCTLGNILEWYDFILYGYFSVVLSKLFFPTDSRFISLLITFSVFASGCLMRPLGSVIFGHIGDRYGRKWALVSTIILITLATTAMGLLPTYQQIGIAAPVLLTICRLVQGFAVSGEEVGAGVFITENAPKHRRAFAGSIVLGSVYVGLLLGSLSVFAVTLLFSKAVVAAWAWRIPFLLALVYGLVALLIRLRDVESPSFEKNKAQQRTAKAPVLIVFRSYAKQLICSTLLCAVFAVAIYLFVVYLPSFFNEKAGYSYAVTLSISSLSLLLVAIAVPLVGLLADKVGPARLYLTGCLCFVVAAYPIFLLLASGSLFAVLVAELIFCALLSLVAGSIFPLLLDNFPVMVRYTGIGIAFNVAMTVFGSTAPIIALSLVKYTNNAYAPFWYLLIAGLVSLVVLPLMEKNDDYEPDFQQQILG